MPEQEYWTEVIGAVRADHPDFVFAAEAYWDLEWDLQQLGFDYCYDKRLYDRLIHDGPDAIRGHLHADLDYQRRLVRFLENHDEPRAATEFAPAKERAAAVVIATLPGATHVARRAVRGLACAAAGVPRPAAGRTGRRGAAPLPPRADRGRRRTGDAAHWELCEASGWPEDSSYTQLLAWSWIDDEQRSLVVINFADAPAAAHIHPPWDDLAERTWRLDDLLSDQAFVRDGADLARDGLYVQLPPFGYHVLATSITHPTLSLPTR